MSTGWQAVETEKMFSQVVSEVRQLSESEYPFMSLDTEFYEVDKDGTPITTDGMVYTNSSLPSFITISFILDKQQKTYLFKVNHITGGIGWDTAYRWFRRLAQEKVIVWAHEAYVDFLMLDHIADIAGKERFRWFREADSIILAHVVQAGVIRAGKKDGLSASFGLKKLVKKDYNYVMMEYKEAVGKPILISGPTDKEVSDKAFLPLLERIRAKGLRKKDVLEMIRVQRKLSESQQWIHRNAYNAELYTFCPYAALDAYYLIKIVHRYYKILETMGYEDIFWDVDSKLHRYQQAMYEAGVRFDYDFYNLIKQEVVPQVNTIRSKWLDKGINIDSSKEVSRLFYGGETPLYKKKDVAKTKKGDLSTGKEAMTHIVANTSKWCKAKSWAEEKLAYAKKNATVKRIEKEFLGQVLKENSDGRIRTEISFAGTNTGRISSKRPNLTNLTRAEDDPYTLRKAFVARDGYTMVAGDYSQIELLLMAYLSKSERLIKLMESGEDMHQANADAMGVTRNEAKTGVYALLYGGREKRVSEVLKCSYGQAKSFIEAFYKTNPDLLTYQQETASFLRSNGYVVSIAGRRRYIPEINAEKLFEQDPTQYLDRARTFLKKNTGEDPSFEKVNSLAGKLAKLDVLSAERQGVNFTIQGSAADIIRKAMADILELYYSQEFNFFPLLQVHDELVFEVIDSQVESFCTKIKNMMEQAFVLPGIIDPSKNLIKCEVKSAKNYANCK